MYSECNPTLFPNSANNIASNIPVTRVSGLQTSIMIGSGMTNDDVFETKSHLDMNENVEVGRSRTYRIPIRRRWIKTLGWKTWIRHEYRVSRAISDNNGWRRFVVQLSLANQSLKRYHNKSKIHVVIEIYIFFLVKNFFNFIISSWILIDENEKWIHIIRKFRV